MILCNSSQVCILICSTRSGHSADIDRLNRLFRPHGSFLSHLFYWFPIPRTTFCITNSPQHLVVASDSSDGLSRLCFMSHDFPGMRRPFCIVISQGDLSYFDFHRRGNAIFRLTFRGRIPLNLVVITKLISNVQVCKPIPWLFFGQIHFPVH